MKKILLFSILLCSIQTEHASYPFLITGGIWATHCLYELQKNIRTPKEKRTLNPLYRLATSAGILSAGLYVCSKETNSTKQPPTHLNPPKNQNKKTIIPSTPPSATLQLSDSPYIITKNNHTITIELKETLSLDTLVQQEHEQIFFDLCLTIADQLKKDAPQATIHFNTNNEGKTICKINKTSSTPCTKTHTEHLCSYCPIIQDHSKGTIVGESNEALAFLSRSTYQYPKCLIIPKKPIVKMGAIKKEDETSIKGMLEIIRSILLKHPEYKAFELEMHNGSAGGQTVFHLHWHFKVPSVNIPAQEAFK